MVKLGTKAAVAVSLRGWTWSKPNPYDPWSKATVAPRTSRLKRDKVEPLSTTMAEASEDANRTFAPGPAP